MSENDKNCEMFDPRKVEAAARGCAESRLLLTRRAMLGVTASLFTLPFLPGYAEASTDTERRLLIVLLRGGLDGLHVAFHKDDRNLLAGYRERMFAEHKALTGGQDYLARYARLGSSEFLWNPEMPLFKAMAGEGQAAIVHAIAPPLRTRSHFDCLDNLENGQEGLANPSHDGWLNRCIAGIDPDAPAARALSVNTAPLILQGNAEVASWGANALGDFGSDFSADLVKGYLDNRDKDMRTRELFKSFGRNLERGLATHKLALEGVSPGGSALTRVFAGAAALMKQPNGPRIGVLTIDGLDTHDNQIAVLDRQLSEIDNGLSAFKTGLPTAVWSNTVVACVTEFGRTVRMNVTGTDHGIGTVAMLAGGNVMPTANREWPRLAKLADDRDLTAAHDIRSLFKGILRDHLGIMDTAFLNKIVFPGSERVAPMAGLIRRVATKPVALNRVTLASLSQKA